MRHSRFLPFFLSSLLALAVVIPAWAQSDSDSNLDSGDDTRVEQLENDLEVIRAEMAKLRAELEAQKNAQADAADEPAAEPQPASLDQRLGNIESQIEILAAELEREKLGESLFLPATESEYGLGVAASKVYQVESGISIGGYGEALFEARDSSLDDGTRSGAKDEADFLRAILYFGYKFNDRWVFNSEIEFEHASTSQTGSASVEFAYLDYLWKPEANLRFGLVLVPMGFVNELHEPPLFLGARRPDIESRIIPSTWRENGLGVFGEVGGFEYRTYLVNGLKGEKFSSSGLRGGRQKGSDALAESIAWVGRLDYTARPGLLVGASAYVGDSGQGITDPAGREIGLGTTIVEAHVDWKHRGFQFRALGVQAELDDVSRLNDTLGLSGSGSVGETLEGYYVEVGYDLFANRGGDSALIPYARWETYDTQAEVPAGFSRNPARDVESLTLGLAYQPIDPLVFKIDYQDYDNGAGTGLDQFNAAIGYIF